MLEGAVPVTRFSAIDDADGWLKTAALPAAMLKSCHWMTAFSVVWLICVTVGVGLEIVAPPEVTTPPDWASAGGAARAIARIAVMKNPGVMIRDVTAASPGKPDLEQIHDEIHVVGGFAARRRTAARRVPAVV